MQNIGSPYASNIANPPTNWWLRKTSFGWDKPQETIEQREIVRRSRLTAWILLAILVTLLVYIPSVLRDAASAFTVAGALLITLFAIVLNRRGFVGLAGTVLVVMMCLAPLSVIVASPDGKISLVYLPAYDILAIPVIVGASILPRWSGFVVAGICTTLIYVDLLVQTKAADLQQAITTYGLPVLAGRPISILIIVALVAFLWVRSMDQAVRRADRAEELQALEQQIIQVRIRWSEEANDFVQGTIRAVAAIANGQETQVRLPPDHSFNTQANFVNTQLHQFYKMKLAAAKGNTGQVTIAINYLLKILQGLHDGRVTIKLLSPDQFSSHVPEVDEIAKYLYFMLQDKRIPSSSGTTSKPFPPTSGTSSKPLKLNP
jgi:hypothetical protein